MRISHLEAKRLANIVYGLDKFKDWDDVKLIAMEDLLRLKLEQHEDVRQALIDSGMSLLLRTHLLTIFGVSVQMVQGRIISGKFG